jgi:hypothetical protein
MGNHRPYRDHRKDGRLYERRAETTAMLMQLEGLAFDQLVERAKIRSKADPFTSRQNASFTSSGGLKSLASSPAPAKYL